MKYIFVIFGLMLLGVGCAGERITSEDAYDVAADANFEIRQLKSRIDELESEQSSLESQHYELNSTVENTEAYLDTTIDMVNDHEQKIYQLQRDVRNLEWNN